MAAKGSEFTSSRHTVLSTSKQTASALASASTATLTEEVVKCEVRAEGSIADAADDINL